MNRALVIHRLIEEQVERVSKRRYSAWLYQALESGFLGFGNMSDEQLDAELRRRGLGAEFEEPEPPLDEDDAEDCDEEESEIRVLIEGLAEPQAA